MAFALVGADNDLGTANEKVSDTTLGVSPTSALTTGNLVCLAAITDNTGTTSADDTTEHSVADALGNTWTKAKEARYSAGAAADGIVASLWWSVLTTGIATSDVITLTLGTARTAKGLGILGEWSFGAGNTIAVAGAGSERIAASAAYTVTVGSLTNEQHLWIGTNTMESGASGVNAIDAGYSGFNFAALAYYGTTGGAAATNVGGRAGYLIETSTTQTYDLTAQASADRVTLLVAFREVVPGGATEAPYPYIGGGYYPTEG